MSAQLQKVITFYGDDVIAVQSSDGAIYVPLARLCDNLSIARARQAQRIREHPVLNRGYTTLTIETSGGAQESQCLRLDMIPLWLSGVNANRVSAEVRDKLIRYQTEVAAVLWEAFKHDILPPAELAPPEQSGAALAFEIATAVQHLARQQLDFEQRLTKSARWAKGIEERVSSIEMQLRSPDHISDAQAAEIAGAVKNVAAAMEAKGTQNGYQRVYAELYRRYSISSYKSLAPGQFDQAMAWLRRWYDEVQDGQAE